MRHFKKGQTVQIHSRELAAYLGDYAKRLHDEGNGVYRLSFYATSGSGLYQVAERIAEKAERIAELAFLLSDADVNFDLGTLGDVADIKVKS